jgi:hypothetical protein
MHMDSTVATDRRNASAPERALAALGFEPGPPAHLDTCTLATDRRAYSVMRCAACKRRGMRFRPMHRGREYRAVAVCRHCGHGEDV